MATKTVEFAVGRGREMGVGGVGTPSPLAPFDIPEPDIGTERMLINIGPQHPATHGVLRLVCELDGETVEKVVPHIGYLHSSFEKLGEYRTWNQIVPLTDRMDYLAAMNMNLGFALAVEKLIGMEVNQKALHLRVFIAELGRIASHLVGMGAYGLDLGTFSPFLYAFREREVILDFFEEVCGARLTCSYLTVGGATHDLPEEIEIPDGLAALLKIDKGQRAPFFEVIETFLQWLEKRIKANTDNGYNLLSDQFIQIHTKNSTKWLQKTGLLW